MLNENDIVLVPSPGWSYYKSVADAKFAKCITYEVCEKEDTYEYNIDDLLQKAKENNPKVIIITSPQMPTGCGISYNDIEKVIKENINSIILLDEAYWGYGNDDNKFEKKSLPNIVM